MKKRPLCLFLSVCLLMTLLGGCGLSDSVLRLYEKTDALRGPDVRETAVLETRSPLYTDAEPPMLWGREQLSEKEQAVYDRMVAAVAAYRETPLEVDANAEELQVIMTAIRMDHPELFWFDGQASFVTSTLAGVPIRTECSFTYSLDRAEIQQAHQKIRQYTAACLSALELSGAASDYDRILGVYRYIIEHTDYSATEADQGILSVMDRHQATCAGYARSFQYLMGQLGIPCTLAMGLDESGESHGWNVVLCDGEWYQMDVTWGDPVGADGRPGNEIQYTYCLITDQEMYRDHTFTGEIPIPVCTATACNYFAREGLAFSSWSPDAYEYALARALERGASWFSVRYSDPAAFEAARHALFEEEAIWEMLRRTGAADGSATHVIYTCKELQREISVKLEFGESET